MGYLSSVARQALPGAAALLAMAGALPLSAASPAPAATVTRHIEIQGRDVAYRAMIARTHIDGATLVSIDYLRDAPGAGPAARPILFIYNGGPGSSSTLLHLVAFGPRRLALGDVKDLATVGQRAITDNPNSPLDVADLVFLDPVGTGFSRADPGREKDFFSIKADGKATADFIAAWLAAHGRQGSPVWLVGESYGALRTVTALGALQARAEPIYAAGAVLIAGPIDFVGFIPALGDDKAYPFFVPSMAATAWYHGTVPHAGRTFEGFVEEAARFGRTQLAPALALGNDLPAAERRSIARDLEKYSGISRDVFLENNLRIRGSQLPDLLLKSRGLRVGRYDTRYTNALSASGDPSAGQISRIVQPALIAYLGSELGAADAGAYQFFPPALRDSGWNWSIEPSAADDVPGLYLNVEPQLIAVMKANPKFRLMTANGIFDLIAPFASLVESARHLHGLQDRVKIVNYPGGHMMYSTDDNAARLAADMRAMIVPDPRAEANR